MYKAVILPYNYSALEPFIDAETMNIHYNKHYLTYLKNLNDEFKKQNHRLIPIKRLIFTIDNYSQIIRNNAGGFYNHSLFWKMLNPNKMNNSNLPTGEAKKLINRDFGNYDLFKKKIEEQGSNDPEDLMLLIMEFFKEEVLYPEPGKFYTFMYNPKTPEIEYDQHPLIACTSLEKWGFKAINFHWRKARQYTWAEVSGKLHVVKYNELDELLAIPYAKFRLNK